MWRGQKTPFIKKIHAFTHWAVCLTACLDFPLGCWVSFRFLCFWGRHFPAGAVFPQMSVLSLLLVWLLSALVCVGVTKWIFPKSTAWGKSVWALCNWTQTVTIGKVCDYKPSNDFTLVSFLYFGRGFHGPRWLQTLLNWLGTLSLLALLSEFWGCRCAPPCPSPQIDFTTLKFCLWSLMGAVSTLVLVLLVAHTYPNHVGLLSFLIL